MSAGGLRQVGLMMPLGLGKLGIEKRGGSGPSRQEGLEWVQSGAGNGSTSVAEMLSEFTNRKKEVL